MKKEKIVIVGSGYVGMSLAVLIAQNHDVVVLDIDSERVDTINKNESTIADREIESFLRVKQLSIKATLNKKEAYKDCRFVIVATPTDYNPVTNKFDTSAVDQVVSDALTINPKAFVVIKSTIPVGHTLELQKTLKTHRVIFSPEFLREGQALSDHLFPSRIIVGGVCEDSKAFAAILVQGAEQEHIEKLFMPSNEAEAVKLYANTYLAMRVSFFNELDSYCLAHDLDSRSIIEGVCLDRRIGQGYNNPSFGYGGYCLPKDTKQLLANFDGIPQSIIQAVVSSNSIRQEYLAREILNSQPRCVGFYRLVMKEGSDNFRSSAVQEIMQLVQSKGVELIIYEPNLEVIEYFGVKVIRDLEHFKYRADIIVANRISDELGDVKSKLFSRDVFRVD